MQQHLNYRGPRRREKERVWENFWRDYSWKFPQNGKGKSQSNPRGTKSPIYRINPRRNTSRHILIKLTKIKHKERILKAAREKQHVIYKGNPICLTADLSVWNSSGQKGMAGYIYKVLKWKNLQPRSLFLARISFKIDGEIKSFSDKQKLRETSTTKSTLQQMLKGHI